MGKITLTVEGKTIGTCVLTKEVSEEDSARLMAAYAKIYSDKWVDEAGNAYVPTYAQIVEKWWGDVVKTSVAKVKSREREDALKAAVAGIKRIEVK